MKKLFLLAVICLAPLSIFCQSVQKDSTSTIVFERDSSVIVSTTQTVEVSLTSAILEAEIVKMQQEKAKLEQQVKAIADRLNQYFQLSGQVKQAEEKLKKRSKK
jgi:hypothetical protein